MDDEEYKAMKAKEDRERELEDSFLDDYNADEIASEAGSEALSESLLEDDEASDIEDSWDEKEFEDGGKRDMEAIHERARARARAKRMKRNKFVAFDMPKISDLKKKAGLLPRTPDGLKKRKKPGKAEEEDETLGIIGEMVDSAKEVLAYFAGEETYEVRKFDIWDIPEVCDKIYETQRRRSIITFLPYFYKLDLTGFRRYYKPATETLLVACRSKYVKPHYIVDLLENGADPNVKEEDTDNSPLHYLCRRGNYQGVRYLVDAGANPIAKNAGRRTPLHSACDTGRTGPQVKIVRYLLKQPGVKECIEHRDSGGNTAAINAIFKNNVWILRTLLLAGARVTEEDPYWGYESAYHVAKWVYAAGLLLDVDQLPAMSHQEDWDQLSLRWRYTAPKGHYKHMPVLWVQTLYKYNAELCFRMCQNKKRAEDSMTYPPRAKREVIKMAEKKRDERRQKRMDKEEAQRRKERNNRKLVNRKLHNEVKEVDDWNLQRELIAKSIDSKYEKGLRGQKDQSTYEWVLRQHRDRKTGEVDEQHWEMAPAPGSHYISPVPKGPKVKFEKVALGRVLEERHNRTHEPKDRIHVFGGGDVENAYARASWVVRDEKEDERAAAAIFNIGDIPDKRKRDPAIVDARGSPAKPNGWKLATRAGSLGFVDPDTQWAKNKITRPFIVPPTEEDVYYSDPEEDQEEKDGSMVFAM